MSEEGARDLARGAPRPARQDRRDPARDPEPARTAIIADQLGVAGKSVILTFGLLSPDKGIEHVIDALPAILARHPETVYIVLGATHPHVKEKAGETYRLGLATRAARLGVEASVIFHDRFVSTVELTEFLSAADIYVTPYLNMEQSTSGTLAYAVGSGRAVISTPYRHAQGAAGRRPRDPGAAGGLRRDRDARSTACSTTSAKRREPARARRARTAPTSCGRRSRARTSRASSARAASTPAARRAPISTRTTLARGRDLPEINFEHLTPADR